MIFTIIKNNSKTKILETDSEGKVQFCNVEGDYFSFPSILQNNFILSRPIKENGVFPRKKEYLNYSDESGYILLDLDNVTTDESLKSIVRYFENTGWGYSIINSRSYNGVSNFNLKVICKINYPSNDENIRNTLLFFKEQLSEYCTIDESVIRYASYQAPSFRILFREICNSDKGIPLSILPKTIQNNNVDVTYKNSVVKWCAEKIKSMGGKFKKYEDYYAVSFPDEVKSKYSYFFFFISPFTVFHSNPLKNVNLLPDFIKTKQGIDFLEQAQTEIISNTLKLENYKSFNLEMINGNEFEFGDVTFIKSPMGTGKSEIIKEYIKTK